ncbi:Tyrosine recombinase XerC [Caulifigura coniformis]|uniref:Tyrosine recombinase XerC n=1 Tax=Caulifigura coniformis TaxID=2527983 RepID=A0A517SDT9_9PLAN|nr:tyrosine-type recombinase/integrase [Caulifigura coniformis]QDT54296.1 Tyrosine recombinase XerC [Caulifigura coniformis]
MAKQTKPYPEFELTAHPNGQWSKKIKGKVHYFGTDPTAARAKYLAQVHDLQAGRTPVAVSDAITTEHVIEAFLDRQRDRVALKEISPITVYDHLEIGRLMARHLGKTSIPVNLTPTDFRRFKVALKYSPGRVSKIITVTRGIFKWASESKLIPRTPDYGPDFKVPNRKQMRLHRAAQQREHGKKMLSAAELQAMLKASDPQFKAILLLSINGGLGNSDIARLKVKDVAGEWLDFARGKTGIDRRVPLWAETREAVAAITEGRDPEQLLFVTKNGRALIKQQANGSRSDRTGPMFRAVANAAGIHRPRMGLYHLRHTFQTIANGARDPQATARIMGHADASMAGLYTEDFDDAQLLAVVNHVHDWLFKKEESK